MKFKKVKKAVCLVIKNSSVEKIAMKENECLVILIFLNIIEGVKNCIDNS